MSDEACNITVCEFGILYVRRRPLAFIGVCRCPSASIGVHRKELYFDVTKYGQCSKSLSERHILMTQDMASAQTLQVIAIFLWVEV